MVISFLQELRFTEQGKLVDRLKEQEKESVSNDISSTSFHKLSVICHNECDKLQVFTWNTDTWGYGTGTTSL